MTHAPLILVLLFSGFIDLSWAIDEKACSVDTVKACSTEQHPAEDAIEEMSTEDLTVKLLQTGLRPERRAQASPIVAASTHIFDLLRSGNGTAATNSKWLQRVKTSWASLWTRLSHEGTSVEMAKQRRADCKACAGGFDITVGCGAIYDQSTGKISIEEARPIYMGAFPDPNCVFCEDFNPMTVCQPELKQRACVDCTAQFNHAKGCGAINKMFAGQMSQNEAMQEVFASFPCEDVRECEFDLQGECMKWQNAPTETTPAPQQGAREERLEQIKQCTGRANCETCLYSWQCAGYGGNPSPIYCCPRMKRCIDVTPHGIANQLYGCAGNPQCPDMCGESPYSQPNYPFDCQEKCPTWDPLSWVTC